MLAFDLSASAPSDSMAASCLSAEGEVKGISLNDQGFLILFGSMWIYLVKLRVTMKRTVIFFTFRSRVSGMLLLLLMWVFTRAGTSEIRPALVG